MSQIDFLKFLNIFALSELLYYKSFSSFIENLQDLKGVWQQINPSFLKQFNINEKNIDKIITQIKQLDPDEQYQKLLDQKIQLISFNDTKYPEALKNIYNPPALLYYKGKPLWQDFGQSLAIVGTRTPTAYGIRAVNDLTKALVERGYLIISGLATGIDTYAHQATIKHQGKTLAVVANGLDIIYPANNKILYQKITEQHCLLSEYPLGSPPLKWHFPQRNRIISGLAQKVLVIEGSRKSGSLITAKMALEQNREVYALPGSVYSVQSSGTNFLIQTGAKIITSINDITDQQDSSQKNFSSQAEYLNNLNSDEKRLYQLISETTNTANLLDNLYEESGYQYEQFNQIITSLELKGLISRLPGQRVVVN